MPGTICPGTPQGRRGEGGGRGGTGCPVATAGSLCSPGDPLLLDTTPPLPGSCRGHTQK